MAPTNLLCRAEDLTSPLTYGEFRDLAQQINVLTEVLANALTINGEGALIPSHDGMPTNSLGVQDNQGNMPPPEGNNLCPKTSK